MSVRRALGESHRFNFKQPSQPSLRANGSRECAPDDRLREAIHGSAKQVWIASSLALLAMTSRYASAISPRVFARVMPEASLPRIRGRRECRALAAPAISYAIKTKHTSVVTTVTPETPGIPRAVVYDLYRALPGDRAFLPPSLHGIVSAKLDASVGASGPHGFAVRIKRPRLKALPASTASRPASVTFASRPSVGRDRIAIVPLLPGCQEQFLKFRN